MSVLTFSVYNENDPNGTALGSFDDTDLISAEFRVALHGLGSGLFTLSRLHADADLIQENRLVKVTIPSVDSDPIFAFWLKEGDFSLVSSDEEGGEHLTFGGPGIMYILAQARLYHSSLVSDQPLRGSQDVPGMWTWINEPYGAILTRIVEEGRESPYPDAATNGSAFEHVTIDFDRVNDSDSVAWPNIDLTYEERIGTDMLQVAERLREAGDIYLVMDPDLSFHAHQSYGRDLTGSFASDNVRFEKGVNILTELKREIAARGAYTHLLQMDSDGAYSTEVLPGYTSAQRKRWGYSEASQTNDDTLLNAIGADTLRRSHTHLESLELEVTPGFSPTTGRYMPGPAGTNGHVWIGDTITLHTGSGDHDYNADANLVTAIRVVLDEASDDSTSDTAARSLHTVYELNYEDVRSARWNDGAPGGGPHTHVHNPNPELCIPGTPSTSSEDEIVCWDWEAGDETVPAIAALSMPSGTVAREAFDALDSYYALFDNSGSASTMPRGNLVFEAPADGAQVRVDWVSRVGSTTSRLAVQWITGDYTDWSGSSISDFIHSIEDIKIWNNGGSGGGPLSHSEIITVPTGASITGFRLTSRDASDVSSTWRCHSLCLTGLSSEDAVPADGHPDLVGTSIKASRCDHEHVILSDRAPSVNDDSSEGIHGPKFWINTTTGELWVLTDDTEGAAVWTQVAQDEGGGTSVSSTVVDHGTMGAAEEFDFTDGTDHEGTLDENLTVTLTGAVSGEASWMTLVLTQDGTGTNTIDLPASVVNAADVEAAFDTTADAVNILSIFTYDGGTTYYAFLAGGSGSPDAADVSITDAGGYYTATDVEAALQEIGADLASGTGGHYELLMTGSSPPEPLEDGTGTDWLYVWVN